MCEAGVNIKVIQEALGHADVSTTLGIYADVTKELRRDEFKGLDDFFKKSEAQMKVKLKPSYANRNKKFKKL